MATYYYGACSLCDMVRIVRRASPSAAREIITGCECMVPNYDGRWVVIQRGVMLVFDEIRE